MLVRLPRNCTEGDCLLTSHAPFARRGPEVRVDVLLLGGMSLAGEYDDGLDDTVDAGACWGGGAGWAGW